MTPGFTVVFDVDTGKDELEVPQMLVEVTEILPDDAVAPQEVVIILLPCPEVIVTPAGTTQL